MHMYRDDSHIVFVSHRAICSFSFCCIGNIINILVLFTFISIRDYCSDGTQVFGNLEEFKTGRYNDIYIYDYHSNITFLYPRRPDVISYNEFRIEIER